MSQAINSSNSSHYSFNYPSEDPSNPPSISKLEQLQHASDQEAGFPHCENALPNPPASREVVDGNNGSITTESDGSGLYIFGVRVDQETSESAHKHSKPQQKREASKTSSPNESCCIIL
jgi:hypothetical protein